MTVHLEGMGVQGALLAHQLHCRGVAFTWHDNDAERTAWKASTGAIYPADSTKFGPDRNAGRFGKCGTTKASLPAPTLSGRQAWCFARRTPPHNGKYPVTELGHGLRLGSDPSFHFNAQTFVPFIREQFKDRRVPQACGKNAKHYVVAHGWGERLHYAYWGWTRLVGLTYPEHYDLGALRPSFYFRPNRFVMAYAYPVPGTHLYYAGSSIIKQKLGAFKSLDIEPKYVRWKENVQKLSAGTVTVSEEGPFIEGWRPASAPLDTAWARKRGNVITLRPLWNNGIRHFPRQWVSVAEILGLTP
jgi:hypothetical protein